MPHTITDLQITFAISFHCALIKLTLDLKIFWPFLFVNIFCLCVVLKSLNLLCVCARVRAKESAVVFFSFFNRRQDFSIIPAVPVLI